MAVWMLHAGCMGLVLGESLGTKPCVFSGKVAPAGDERYLVCAEGAIWIVLTCDWFRTVGVASRCSVRVFVCVVIGCFGVLGRRWHWNGCMNVAILCCDVRR